MVCLTMNIFCPPSWQRRDPEQRQLRPSQGASTRWAEHTGGNFLVVFCLFRAQENYIQESQSLHLHPVEDKAGHLPWEADRTLTNLGHKGASTRADLQICKTGLCGHCTQWQIKCKFFVRYKEAKEYRNWNVQKPRCWSMVQAPTRPWVCGTEGCTGAPRWTGLCAPWSPRSCSELCSAKISTVDNGKQWIESHRCRRWRCPRWSRCPPACPPRPTPSSWGRAPPARTPARTSPQWHTLPSLPSH